MSIYDDPRFQVPEDRDYPEDVKFNVRGDNVTGRITKIEPLQTRHGLAVKYYLFDGTGQQRTMLSGPTGARDLWKQLLENRPEPGDVLFVSLTDVSESNAKYFDVRILERGGAQASRPQPAPVPQPQPVSAPPAPAPYAQPAPVPQYPQPQPVPTPAAPAWAEPEEDLFDR